MDLTRKNKSGSKRSKNPKWGSRAKKIKWKDSEAKTLIELVKKYGEKWTRIEQLIKTKTAKQCMQKYKNLVKVEKKGNWTEQEDILLLQWVEVHGPNKWTECARRIEGRCGKQCRERWMNTLDPRVKRGNWKESEQMQIFEQMQENWSSWATISKHLQGRTENAIKNYFYSSVRRLKATCLFRFLQIVLFGTCVATPLGNSIFGDFMLILNSVSKVVVLIVTVNEDQNEAPNAHHPEDPQLALQSEELSVMHLQKEYLKMNRLTQKLVAYLVNMKGSDHKFGMFLVGILFGEKQKADFRDEGLCPKFATEKSHFRAIVNKHLKAAEMLSLQEIQESSDQPGNSHNFDPSQYVNRRLGSYLYPPERAKKFQTIFENKKNKKSGDGIGSESERSLNSNFGNESEHRRRRYANGQVFELEQATGEFGMAEDGDVEDQVETRHQEKTLQDLVDFSYLPEKYYFHWQFLKHKVNFYQARLKNFYGMLSDLAFQKMRSERENVESNGALMRRMERAREREISSTFHLEKEGTNLRKRNNEELNLADQDERLTLKKASYSGKTFPYFRN